MNLSIKNISQRIALGLGIGLGTMGPVNEAEAYKIQEGVRSSRIESTIPEEALGPALGATGLLGVYLLSKKKRELKSALKEFLDLHIEPSKEDEDSELESKS